MSAQRRLEVISTVDALVAALRPRILEGELPGGARLREQDLSDDYGVARHTLRSALRELAAEGLVVIEPNRGARVASLGADELRGLADLRIALEVESARLALERDPHGGLPEVVHERAEQLARVCRRKRPAWSAVVDAHDALHTSIVEAANSPRLAAAYRSLTAELRLVIVQLRPAWTLERMADDHLQLVRDLERTGAEVLRPHIRESTDALVAQAGG
ncbi:MAG TPA: GntR family transcriptional regulator [Thermoleophilaceae bacterium]|jgi:DNA-binding GntR family transcriptional regulator